MFTGLVIASLIATAVSAATSLAGTAMSAQSTKSTNQANIDFQREVNQQQIEMANTAHQREVADLKAAGLNPVLSATGGNGSPVASISSPKMQAPQYDLSGVGTAITGAIQSITNMKLADTISERYKELNQSNILAQAPGRDAKAEYYRELVRNLRRASNASEVNAAVNSPVQLHSRKFKRKLSFDEIMKELDKLPKS